MINVESIEELIIENLKRIIAEKEFIDDSDNVNRIIDKLVRKELDINGDYEDLTDEEEEILWNIRKKLNKDYNKISELKDNGDYIAFYYNKNLNFNNIKEFENYFNLGE